MNMSPLPDDQTAPPVVSLSSLTAVLAYLAHYSPDRLQRGFLAARHLRVLADWIGAPAPNLRSVRRHPLLMAHFALLTLLELLPAEGPLLPLPAMTRWLHEPPVSRLEQLVELLADPARWQHTLQTLHWHEDLPFPYSAYLQQQFQRQLAAPSPKPAAATWVAAKPARRWLLRLPHSLPDWIRFDLLQIGNWTPPFLLTCTPLTVARAVHRGYGFPFIRWLLAEATGLPLPAARETQLARWVKRASAYRLQPATLLSVSETGQLQDILARRRLRAHVHEQLSPRHALVSSALVVPLRRWLAAREYALDTTLLDDSVHRPLSSPAYEWLGLRLLVGLGTFIPLPYPPPHGLLDGLARRLTEAERGELETLARSLLDDLAQALHGRDAFFPAPGPPEEEKLHPIQAALREQTSLDVWYQGLGDEVPRFRHLQPLRLEQKGQLFYLHAHCYQAARTLTFRLDRIAAVRPSPTGRREAAPHLHDGHVTEMSREVVSQDTYFGGAVDT